MQRTSLAWIVVLAAIIICVGYLFIAKPVIVLPTQTVKLPPDTLTALQHQLNVNQFAVKARTDGKALILADGKEVGYISYNLGQLKNAYELAEKMSLTPNDTRVIRVIANVFPQLTWNAVLTLVTVYSVLPIEVTVQFS